MSGSDSDETRPPDETPGAGDTDPDASPDPATPFAPPGRSQGLRSNPVMLGVVVVTAVAVVVFVVALVSR